MHEAGTHTTEGRGPRAAHEPSHRRCLITRAVRPKRELLRFVLGPDGAVVPDLAAVLPGRGMWISSRSDVLDRAIAKNAFGRAAKAQVQVGSDLRERVAALLARRFINMLGLARGAGQAVCGFAKVPEAVRRGRADLLLDARDGAAGGRGKLRGLAKDVPVLDLFTGAELGAAFGRDYIVHVAVGGKFAEQLRAEGLRLAGFRPAAQDSGAE